MGRGASALVEDLVQHLRTRLLAGEMAAGERVSESGVASEYGVARPTARAALEILVGEGLLTRQAYSAMRVPQITRTDLPEILGLLEYTETQATQRALADGADVRQVRDAAELSLHQLLAALVASADTPRLARVHRRSTFELVLGLHALDEADVAISCAPQQARTDLAATLFAGDRDGALEALRTLQLARRSVAGVSLEELALPRGV